MRRRRSWKRSLPKLGWVKLLSVALLGGVSLVGALGVAVSVGAREVSDSSLYARVSGVALDALDAPQEDTDDGFSRRMTASYYGREFAGLPTASGPVFDPKKLTAAHKSLPLGTKLLVRHEDKSMKVTVADRGPYIKGREIDLSRAAAKEIGLIGPGTGEVQVTER